MDIAVRVLWAIVLLGSGGVVWLYSRAIWQLLG